MYLFRCPLWLQHDSCGNSVLSTATINNKKTDPREGENMSSYTYIVVLVLYSLLSFHLDGLFAGSIYVPTSYTSFYKWPEFPHIPLNILVLWSAFFHYCLFNNCLHPQLTSRAVSLCA